MKTTCFAVVVALAPIGAVAPAAGQSLAGPQGSVLGQSPVLNNPALTQRTFEIVCHGGPGLRVDPVGSGRHALYFQMSANLPGQYGAGLKPGECSPADRLFSAGEPPGIQFVDVAGDQSVTQHKADANHYWRFDVVGTSYGYFEARSYQRVFTPVSASPQPPKAAPDQQGQILAQSPVSKNAAPVETTFGILCHGGPAFRVDPAGSGRHAVYFQMSVTLPGQYGEGLKPAECSPLDRLFSPGEPPGIQFVDMPGEQSVSQYKADANRYWRFDVVKTNYGYFEARSYQLVLAPAPANSIAGQAAAPTRQPEATIQSADTPVPNPVDRAALNPQPLPPKETTIQPADKVLANPVDRAGANPQPQLPTPSQVSQPTVSTASQPSQSALSGASTFLPSAGGSSLNVKTEEIRCKGGPGLNFQTVSVGSTAIMQLNFPHAREASGFAVAAGDNGEGLTPATCSFVSRGMNDDEPSGIRFETAASVPASPERDLKQTLHGSSRSIGTALTRADQESIPAYLSDPAQYWSFQVYNTSRGHFFAVTHGPWRPKSTTPIAETASNPADSKAVIARLTGVRVYPELGGVRFSFIGRPSTTPLVEVSKEPPVVGRDGQAVFRNSMEIRAVRDRAASSSTVTTYTASSTALSVKLEQGESYHYIITVPGNASVPVQQATGTFTTKAQVITVHISQINLLSVSGNDGLRFDFWVNPGERSQRSYGGGEKPWGPGRHVINQTFTTSGAERVRIVVRGSDHERPLLPAGCLLSELDTTTDDNVYDGRPGMTSCSHWNYAKGEFDANAVRNRNLPFVLRATLGPHGSRIAFDVTGSIEVSVPK